MEEDDARRCEGPTVSDATGESKEAGVKTIHVVLTWSHFIDLRVISLEKRWNRMGN